MKLDFWVTPFFRITETSDKDMITQEQLKETEERKLALRRYL